MSGTGPPHALTTPRRAALAATLALALLGAGCGSDEPETSPTSTAEPTTTTRRPTTTTTAAPVTDDESTTTSSSVQAADPAQQEIVDAYVGYWDARFAANSGVPNPADPALARYATGRQLEAVIAETQKNLDEGLALRPNPEPANYRRVEVTSVDGDSAVVQECFVDDALVVTVDTGDVVNDTVATHNVRAELQRVDGQWRVAQASLIQRWEGVAGCALAS